MSQSETVDGDSNEVELSPSRTAKVVRDRVLIRKRSGNPVQKIFISEEDWQEIGRLFDRSIDSENSNA